MWRRVKALENASAPVEAEEKVVKQEVLEVPDDFQMVKQNSLNQREPEDNAAVEDGAYAEDFHEVSGAGTIEGSALLMGEVETALTTEEKKC